MPNTATFKFRATESERKVPTQCRQMVLKAPSCSMIETCAKKVCLNHWIEYDCALVSCGS